MYTLPDYEQVVQALQRIQTAAMQLGANLKS
jgi:hypothetical protein